MSKAKIHLHHTYSRSWCNKDISHVLATQEPKETTCAGCKSAYVKEAEKEVATAQAKLAERQKAVART